MLYLISLNEPLPLLCISTVLGAYCTFSLHAFFSFFFLGKQCFSISVLFRAFLPPANWWQHTKHLQCQRYQHFTVGHYAKSLVYILFLTVQFLLWMKCYYCAHYGVEETKAYNDELVRSHSWKTVEQNQTLPVSTCLPIHLLNTTLSARDAPFTSDLCLPITAWTSATRTPNCPLLLILVSGISHPHCYPGRRQRSLWISSCVSSPASCWRSSPLSSAS